MSHHHRRAAAISAPDPFFSNTVLLLTGNGTNGGQNNTFIDDSSNNFTITRNGNTTQGSFSPFGWQWSNYFDGTGDYLTVADNANLRPGTSSFTLEAWVYRNASGAAHTIFAKGSSTGPTGLVFQITSTNVLRFTDTSTNIDSTGTISANGWTHVAVVREGTGTNQTKLYINGTQDGQGTSSTDFTQTDQVRIGRDRSTTAEFNGYISSLRFLKGTAQYNANFTPSTTPLTVITNTQLLTCQSNRFVDNSTNAFTITRNGDVAVSNFSPFPAGEYATAVEGGSGYFDGTGDYLTVPSNANLNPSNGAFTWECWFYPLGSWDQTSTTGDTLWITEVSNGLQIGRPTTLSGNTWGLCSNAVAWRLTSTTLPTIGAWNHMAVVRSGTGTNQTALFLNGNRVAQGTVSATFAQGTSYIMDGVSTGPTECSGYLACLRFVNGSAVYDPASSTYTVPTSPLTAITNTQLLLNFTNGSIVNATGKNNLETVGNAQISTSVKKFGTGSLKFDGTGDALLIPKSSLFDFGTGDFTIEAWVYPTATGGKIIVDARSYDALEAYVFSFTSSDKLDFIYSSSRVTSSGTIAQNTWTHVAVVRSSGTIKLYINGTEDGSASYSSAINANQSPAIGGGRSTGGSSITGYYFNGYIDDLRITKGVARYTANFTPPYRQLPTR